VLGTHVHLHHAGLTLEVVGPWGEGEIHSGLVGRFNAENLLGAAAVLAAAMEMPFEQICARLAQAKAPAGRMERFGGHGGPLVVVDYAHTPDALAQALAALREHCSGRLWCVFGCGGDRDPGKRPMMGEAAERLADRVVVTDDNPRHEEPTAIVAQILDGMRNPQRARVEHARAAAIELALSHAQPEDVVLVAGKGHEDYQEVKGERRPFCDRTWVQSLLAAEPLRWAGGQ
jgi:UDP-N-acetylmuramoyl-L-alanyl-D-glutamate--2,6-diaminopimelate ligase